MALKTVSQRKFLKGLIATQPKWDQSPGSVPRISNLLLQARGGLTTCDGSLFISRFNGVTSTGDGPWTELFLFQPVNVNRYYIGIKKDPTTQLAAPTGLAVVDGGAGGTLAAATYRYKVTALDGAGGETTASTEVSFANPGAHKANVSWNVVTNAVTYNVYRTAAGGAVNSEVFLTNVSTNAFIDDNSITPGVATPPNLNTTQQCLFFKIPANSYTAGNILATFPADVIVPVDGTPGGDGGGPSGGPASGPSAGAPPNPAGGISGNISPIPQIVQFANFAILALGNGFAPQLFTDPSTVAAITNTFTASYPNWLASTVFATGSKIMPTAGNAGNFVFTATQGGTSGGGAPTWPQTPNQVVSDNNIIWTNTGATNTAPAPRGAAHAIVYAGCLWLYNTSPTTTADNFDGPSCLKMSDLNNPKSWNPLNTAFLGKDDGDYGTGLATFTVAAQGISPTGSLIAFKNFKTFQIIGVFGSSNFSIQEAQTDMGCIAPRSIQFLPGFGIVRLTHLGVAIFDGVNDRLISEEIRPYLFGGQSDIQSLDWNFAYFAKGAQTARPPMYTLAIPTIVTSTQASEVSLTTIGGLGSFTPGTYFLIVTAFTNVNGVATETSVTGQVSFTISGTTSFQANLVTPDPNVIKYRIYIGTQSLFYSKFVEVLPSAFPVVLSSLAAFPNNGSVAIGTGGLTRLLCYDLVLKAWTIIDLPFSISVLKQVRAVGSIPITITGGFLDGTVRRIQSNDPTFDGSVVNWNVRSAEIFGKLTDSRIYYRRLTLRGTTTQTNLQMTAKIGLDGAEGISTPMTVYQLGNTLGTFDFLAQVDIGFTNYTSHITISGSGNIEIDAFDWEASTLREGVPPVI